MADRPSMRRYMRYLDRLAQAGREPGLWSFRCFLATVRPVDPPPGMFDAVPAPEPFPVRVPEVTR